MCEHFIVKHIEGCNKKRMKKGEKKQKIVSKWTLFNGLCFAKLVMMSFTTAKSAGMPDTCSKINLKGLLLRDILFCEQSYLNIVCCLQ